MFVLDISDSSLRYVTINISPLRGDHVPQPIDMPFRVLTLVPDVIIPAKCYVDPLKGFWEGAPPKVPFPILFGTTVTTVLHYRADCDSFKSLPLLTRVLKQWAWPVSRGTSMTTTHCPCRAWPIGAFSWSIGLINRCDLRRVTDLQLCIVLPTIISCKLSACFIAGQTCDNLRNPSS